MNLRKICHFYKALESILWAMEDFHIHLTRLPMARQLAIDLLEAGIGFNTIACEPWEWIRTLKLKDELERGNYWSEENAGKVSYSFGIHPMIANSTSEKDLRLLEAILRGGESFQMGECGLDKRFEGYEPGGVQEQILVRQVELAFQLKRSVQIHCVGDYHRIIQILQNAGFDNCKGSPTIVFHRFGGDISVVKAAQKLNVIYSIHKDSFRKKSTLKALAEVPDELVRIETDADESFKF